MPGAELMALLQHGQAAVPEHLRQPNRCSFSLQASLDDTMATWQTRRLVVRGEGGGQVPDWRAPLRSADAFTRQE